MKILLKGFVCVPDFSGISRQTVLIENDRIIAVEKDIYGSSAADKVYSFKDEIIAPGFIDAHGHSDLSALASPACESKAVQGITAEVCGNCGLSPFPVTGNNRSHLEELYCNYGIPLDWHDHTSYMEMVRKNPLALQLIALCGHNTLRAAVAGYEKSELSGREIDEMCRLLQEQLSGGAAGLSSGLLYVPGCFAEPDELLALMRVVARNNKVYTTHLRSEGDKLLESLEETLELARKSGLKKVLISHLKTAGKDNFSKLAPALEMIADYRSLGIDVRFDRYPYTESQTMLSVVLGEAYSAYGDSELAALLAKPQEHLRAVEHLRTLRDENYWSTRRLAGTRAGKYRKFQGMRFSEIPFDPVELVVDILQCNAPDSTVAAASMSESNMLQIISHDLCLFGSDGNALPADERFGRPHPRSWGSAPHFARLLLDKGMAIEKVCRKLAGDAAEFFALENQGKISPGQLADITVFSPENIDSAADFGDPCQVPQGITCVFKSGRSNHF